ncbi:MAG: type II toxin-antitoxin system RelE/ParE family toxin [Bacteroidetes bacterium]|nr:type II toxin-antitoxin system RelE/ParE family toxin [Bacteroidota bacterium]
MKVSFDNTFDKQLNAIKDKKLLNEIAESVKNVIAANNIKDINNLLKLKGFKSAYRIRTGNYRIGIYIIEDEVTFSAILHRKEIYRKFP